MRLIHISTDFVFDGRASQPYRPESPAAPLGSTGAANAPVNWRCRARSPTRSSSAPGGCIPVLAVISSRPCCD
ncbi:MAG: sugar nucleotide-binding protein [Halioglobus sp.]